MRRLENKVAIVTGGGRGLGKIFCLAMAEQGAKIVSADILEKDSLETAQEIKKRRISHLPEGRPDLRKGYRRHG
jgi:NAD(P)-dependent dehydrogenase (short-subunit alcohol dehydrogenase family)